MEVVSAEESTKEVSGCRISSTMAKTSDRGDSSYSGDVRGEPLVLPTEVRTAAETAAVDALAVVFVGGMTTHMIIKSSLRPHVRTSDESVSVSSGAMPFRSNGRSPKGNGVVSPSGAGC